jgi:aspartyl-tRNA(Asn)/glutamyl-tRNA(Gln) amidotransferase subunit B
MSYIIQGETGDWEVVIGLEVHAQAITNSKLFSGASASFGSAPNENVSLVDAAMPGMLPVINKMAIEQAVRTGLGLRAEINDYSVFERKNYFYADLPQGYQISQYLYPIVGEGTVTIDLEDGSSRDIGVERLHLEQDAGKSVHDQDPSRTMIDLNRSGVVLMEIVSKPDMRSPDEAGAYVRKIRAIVRYLGTCDGNMEEGSMRADVNVSVRKVGETDFRTRVEVKNVNSVRFVMQAVEVEAERQVEVWEDGGEVVQETRLFDPNKGETRAMRTKEFAHDYRYFPDPDLLPVKLEDGFVDQIRSTLLELPDEKKARLINDLGLSAYDAGVIVADRDTAAYFEEAADGHDAKTVTNWLTTNLFGALNKRGLDIGDSPVSARHLGELVGLIEDETISTKIAKDVFEDMLETSKSPGDIVEEKGLKQITNTGAIEAIVDQVIADNPGQADDVRGGNDKAIGWFVGQVMKASQGKANPGQVNQLLRAKLLG